jgi:hypothetical protein
MATAAELLEQVNTAISNCLTAQMTSVRGRQLQFARLKELKEFRESLIAEVNESANSGSMSSVGQIYPAS